MKFSPPWWWHDFCHGLMISISVFSATWATQKGATASFLPGEISGWYLIGKEFWNVAPRFFIKRKAFSNDGKVAFCWGGGKTRFFSSQAEQKDMKFTYFIVVFFSLEMEGVRVLSWILPCGNPQFCGASQFPKRTVGEFVVGSRRMAPNFAWPSISGKTWKVKSLVQRDFSRHGNTCTLQKLTWTLKMMVWKQESPFYSVSFSGVMLVLREGTNFNKLPISH